MPSGDLLGRGLEALGLASTGHLYEALGRYIGEIERLNPSLGLVGASGEELVVKHILDSLSPIGLIRTLIADKKSPHIADLGTGAGLPGIPLALALPEADFALIDRMTRRIRFLESVRDLLDLTNVEIVEEQVEHARGSFDVVVFRAFRPFERKLFKRVFALCDDDGVALAYKGKQDKARSELPAIEGLYSSAEIVKVKVPFLDDERCVVIVKP